MSNTSRSKASFLVTVGIALSSILLTLLLIEAAFRALSFFLPTSAPWSDRPKLYYKPVAADTLQDFAYQTPKPPNTFRIAVIGDSFSFAPYMQFDDAFPKRLERMLNLNNIDLKTEVINYGVPGYSTNHEVTAARQAVTAGADLVLLQITLNDPQLKPYRPTGLVGSHQFGPYEPNGTLTKHWRSLRFVVERLHNGRTHRDYRDYYFELFRDGSKTLRRFSEALSRFGKLRDRRGATVVAVLFPLFGTPLDDHYPFHPLHRKVIQELDTLQIPNLDLFPTFQGIPLDRLQVLPGADFHPNEIGHRLAAESIYAWLVRQKLLPPELKIQEQFTRRTDIRPLPELKISK